METWERPYGKKNKHTLHDFHVYHAFYRCKITQRFVSNGREANTYLIFYWQLKYATIYKQDW